MPIVPQLLQCSLARRHRKPDVFTWSSASKDRGAVTVEKTAVYADIVSLQKVLVPTYIFLPLWLAVVLSMVRNAHASDKIIGSHLMEIF